GDFLLGARDAKRLDDQAKFANWASERKLNPTILRRWMKDLDEREKKSDPIFGPWFKLAAMPDADFSTNAKVTVEKALAEVPQANPDIAKVLTEQTTNSLKQVVAAYNKLFNDINAEWKALLKEAKKEKQTAPTQLPNASHEALRQILYVDGTPLNLPDAEARQLHARRLGEGSAPIRNKIQALSWTHPGVPLRAMAMVDRGNPGNSRVFLRGNPGSP